MGTASAKALGRDGFGRQEDRKGEDVLWGSAVLLLRDLSQAVSPLGVLLWKMKMSCL